MSRRLIAYRTVHLGSQPPWAAAAPAHWGQVCFAGVAGRLGHQHCSAASSAAAGACYARQQIAVIEPVWTSCVACQLGHMPAHLPCPELDHQALSLSLLPQSEFIQRMHMNALARCCLHWLVAAVHATAAHSQAGRLAAAACLAVLTSCFALQNGRAGVSSWHCCCGSGDSQLG